MRARIAVVASVVLAVSACSSMGDGFTSDQEERNQLSEQEAAWQSTCSWISSGDAPSVRVEKLVLRDDPDVDAAIEQACPEYLDDLAEAHETAEYLEYEEFEPEESGQAEAEADPKAAAKPDEPTYAEMYPVAVDYCTKYMVDEGIVTKKATARSQCEAAMNPDDADTHWMIDQYYTAAN